MLCSRPKDGKKEEEKGASLQMSPYYAGSFVKEPAILCITPCGHAPSKALIPISEGSLFSVILF